MVRAGFEITAARSAADLDAARLFEACAASLAVDLAYEDFGTELATLPGKYAARRRAAAGARRRPGAGGLCGAQADSAGRLVRAEAALRHPSYRAHEVLTAREPREAG